MTFPAIWVFALAVGLILFGVYLMISIFFWWLGGIVKRGSGQ